MKGFLRADGQRLVNEAGQEVLLRGVGLGSWLLPEGYMWRFPDQGDRPRRIERMVTDLIGPSLAEKFWAIYRERYIAEADIRRIAAEGFNSVRVPILARTLDLGLLDRVIGWCRKYGLYVILDLHGAPGGQTGTNIDDSERDRPELFTAVENQRLTVELWRTLAQRYRDEWIIAGYDLLNEPLPNWFAAYNDQVMPLYREIIRAIREEDDRHMIILEGVHWATDWSLFDAPPADNLMLQFHKYWNNPDTESIRPFLDKRAAWNVPIFMGEGGENNRDWYAGAFRLFEDHRISWNFWTWKKMDTDNSPCSVNKPAEWQRLVAYLQGGERPDAATAERILWEYLDNLAYERCVYHPEVVGALLRRPPVRIPAIFYGYGHDGFGVANPAAAPAVGFRVSDGTDIRFVESSRTAPNFQHGRGEPWQPDEWLCVHMGAGDWLTYAFRVDCATHRLTINLRLRGQVAVSVDDAWVGEASTASPRLEAALSLAPGEHRVVVTAQSAGTCLEWVELS